jgi:hypothetical protein
MRKPAHHLMAYNTQIAVDGKYKFIVATDISTKGVDLDQLYPLSIQAKEATGNKKIKVAADAGYYNPKEIKKCVDEGIDVYVPIQDKQKQQKDKGLFDGLKIHPSGTVFATGPGGVLLIKSNGNHIGTIRTEVRSANCAFDDKYEYLYITSHQYLIRFSLYLKVVNAMIVAQRLQLYLRVVHGLIVLFVS